MNYLVEIKRRLRSFVLQGQDVEYFKRTGSMNKMFEVEHTDQAINIIGYALNIPFHEFSNRVTSIEAELETGDGCLIAENDKKEKLKKLVCKIRTRRFALLPLAILYESGGHLKIEETLLIKVEDGANYSYVDTIGRMYSSFDQFLSRNKLPKSQLFYPKGGKISFDVNDEIEVALCAVGEKNANIAKADISMGILGSAGAIGAIFASGGLAIPFVVTTMASSAYGLCRGIDNLLDADLHGMSLDPFECSDARSHWFDVAVNLIAFASAGATLGIKVADKLGVNIAKTRGALITSRALKYTSAGVSTAAMIDTIVYSVNRWKTLTFNDKIRLACAVCFCFREVISLINTERLIRNIQLDGVCQFFTKNSTSKLAHIRKTFLTNNGFLNNGLQLVQIITKKNIQLSTDQEFTVISIFGHEYKINFVLNLPDDSVSKFVFMLKGIPAKFKDLFSVLRKMLGDKSIVHVVLKEGDEMGGNLCDYGTAINQLIEIVQIFQKCCKYITELTESGFLIIGAGHRFTLRSAYKIFVTIACTKAVSLLNALLELEKHECTKLNTLRNVHADGDVFEWIVTGCNDSKDMLGRIRFILKVHDISNEKQVHITKFQIDKDSIEIEGLMCIDQKLLTEAAHPTYLIDPRFIRLLKKCTSPNDKYLERLYKATCISKKLPNKSFEKLDFLVTAFESHPESILNVISYAQKMNCSHFTQYYYHAMFAFNNIKRMREQNRLEGSVIRNDLINDIQPLVSRFNMLKETATQLQLDGFCPVLCSDDKDQDEWLTMMKNLAKNEELRFGPIENAVLHLDKYSMLRLSSEIGKYNRFIAKKKFSQEEVRVADGKVIILMANEQMRIEVGVVPGVGFYIDDFSFTISNRP